MARSSYTAKPDLTLDTVSFSRSKRRPNRRLLFFMLLSLIILIGAASALFFSSRIVDPAVTGERLKLQGERLYKAKRYEQASERLALYAAIRPRDWRAREMLADSYWRTGDTKRAFDELGAVDRYAKPQGDRLYKLGLMASQLGRAPAAIVFLEKAIKADSRSLLFQIELAKTFVKAGDVDRAITEWEAALKLLPDRDIYSAVIYAELGDVLLRKGEIDKAKEAYRRGLEVEPANVYLQAQAAKAGG